MLLQAIGGEARHFWANTDETALCVGRGGKRFGVMCDRSSNFFSAPLPFRLTRAFESCWSAKDVRRVSKLSVTVTGNRKVNTQKRLFLFPALRCHSAEARRSWRLSYARAPSLRGEPRAGVFCLRGGGGLSWPRLSARGMGGGGQALLPFAFAAFCVLFS